MTWTGQPAFWQGRACHQTPDDLWNFAEVVWRVAPMMVLEVGTGDGGTSEFLKAVHHCVVSVDVGEIGPRVDNALVMLDGDVYSEASMLSDLHAYGVSARWLVVCHTNREDWGSAPALREYLSVHPEWAPLPVRHPTQHTWLVRS